MKATLRFLFFFSSFVVLAPWALADDVALYNSIPNPLPGNIPSLSYEATGTGEFGGLIQFAGGGATTIDSATVVMSDWTYASQWTLNGTTITSSGFYLPITLTLYSVGADNSVGAVITSQTLANAFIPWRPEPDPSASCYPGSNVDYQDASGHCWAGSLSTLTFNFPGQNLPSQIIYGLSYSTTHYGTDPTGVPGPYKSLNFGLSTTAPTVGSNPLPGTAYWETVNSNQYADGGAGGSGTLRQDTNWSPYSGAIEFDGPAATPEPSSLMLLGTGLFALAMIVTRKSIVCH